MNKRIKKLWIKALRSGEYRQAKGALRKGRSANVRYCCPGVLEHFRTRETGDTFTRGKCPNQGLLSKKTTEWAGLNSIDPTLMPLRHKIAADLNDAGKSFNYIADRIEKYL